jgi:eukaryotic-like serine/threonine-protein kinase
MRAIYMRYDFEHSWERGKLIGHGGFGQVYEARGEDGTLAVIKLVPKAPGADRELLFAHLRGVRNIVPVIDHGETAKHWAIVMQRAEKSLRQHLEDEGGTLDLMAGVAVLSDIAVTLTDLDGRVVHRDLKPENMLLLEGHWCLSDFGISRYAEATTAPDTQKYAMSPPYTSPERWRSERASSAADVYSLGVVAYELLIGSRPFEGPGWEDFRDQHLHHDPPPVGGVPPLLAALVNECLYKAPEARPSPANILARLGRVEEGRSSTGLGRLQEANRAEAARRGISVRKESEHQSESDRQKALSAIAHRALEQISDALKEAIRQAAPLSEFSAAPNIGWTVQLNESEFRLDPPEGVCPNAWGNFSGQMPAFEVIAYSALTVSCPSNDRGYSGRSHSLWFCDAREMKRYQWFETAFMARPMAPIYGRQSPYALKPSSETAKALWRGSGDIQVAWPFSPINVGDLDEFIGRWAGWLADAAQGRLMKPSSMPERDPRGSWRQS